MTLPASMKKPARGGLVIGFWFPPYFLNSFAFRPDWRIMDCSVPVGMSSPRLCGVTSTIQTEPWRSRRQR